jgi:hypothetical protein
VLEHLERLADRADAVRGERNHDLAGSRPSIVCRQAARGVERGRQRRGDVAVVGKVDLVAHRRASSSSIAAAGMRIELPGPAMWTPGRSPVLTSR